jgi:hypothetical protein
MTTTSKLRYEVKPRSAYTQTPAYPQPDSRMVVDNREAVAVKFGTKSECELAAFQMNDSGMVG